MFAHALLHTCKEHYKVVFFWQLKTANLIYAGNSHGYMNALELMKEDRTGKLLTGTNTYTVEIIYIEGTCHQKGFKNFGFTNLNL